MSEKEVTKGQFPKDLFRSLFKDLGYYFFVLVLGILAFSSRKIYEVYADVFTRSDFWYLIGITVIILIVLGLIVYFYKPMSKLMYFPVGCIFFAVVFDFQSLFKVSLISAIAYPIWILVNNYQEYRQSQLEIKRKFK